MKFAFVDAIFFHFLDLFYICKDIYERYFLGSFLYVHLVVLFSIYMGVFFKTRLTKRVEIMWTRTEKREKKLWKTCIFHLATHCTVCRSTLAYFRSPNPSASTWGTGWQYLPEDDFLVPWQWMLQGSSWHYKHVCGVFLTTTFLDKTVFKLSLRAARGLTYMIKGHSRWCPLRDLRPHVDSRLSVPDISCSWVACTTNGAHYRNEVQNFTVVRSWPSVYWDRLPLTI